MQTTSKYISRFTWPSLQKIYYHELVLTSDHPLERIPSQNTNCSCPGKDKNELEISPTLFTS